MTAAVTRRIKTGDARRRAAAWLALLVFALNVLAPVLVNAPVRAATGVESLLDGQIVICTPAGLRVVGADGDLRPLSGDRDNSDVQFCAFCLPLVNAGLGALPAADIVLLPPTPRRVAPLPPGTTASAPAGGRHRLPQPRAPPSVVA